MPTLRFLSSPTDLFFDHGGGKGASWLQEHLQGDYHRRWSTSLKAGGIEEPDAAIADTSLSRWVNYYVQGLQWLTEDHANTSAIDGVYLDEVAFDRATVQRMRKAVDQHRSGALFDLHSCNKFRCGVPSNPHACSSLIYMAHFAFLDSLWLGEGFSPDYPPDQWLVEMSGIPYGMHAEQLSSPNLWRGMIFAEGARPAPDLWKAWDSLELTAPGVKLVGWWDAKPVVQVHCATCNATAPEVVASFYHRPGKGGVISVASWADAESPPASVTLSLDWSAIGLTPATAAVTIPPIASFQNATASRLDPTKLQLAVQSPQGFLIDVRAKA